MTQTDTRTPEVKARIRAKYLTGLIWHVGAFFILNLFLWVLDAGIGQEGIQWAYWITGMWGIALAFHALAYYVDGRQMVDRKTGEYLDGTPR